MNGNRLGFLILVVLFSVLLLATVGCIVPARSPTPTTWYMVITNTPPPSPTPFVPASPTPTPSPTISAAPTPTDTPVPTPPPLPTTPPTQPPTAPPPPPSPTLPPPPTAAATFTPVPTTPPQDVCKGDEEMTFEPEKPKVGEKLTIKVTSAKAHQNVRLQGPGNLGAPDKVEEGGKGYIWIWTMKVTQPGRMDFSFYVGSTLCTANRTSAEPETPQSNVELTCADPNVTSAPGKVTIVVTMKNIGGAQDTFNVSISKSLPAGWQAQFCFGNDCHSSGTVPRTLGPGASEQIKVEITIPAGASSGQKGSVTVNAISQSDASVKASLKVSATVQ